MTTRRRWWHIDDGAALSESRGSVDPLVIRSLEFLGPMATVDGWRPQNELPEVAFAGRSNVGKSSLLNKLVRRKAFARVRGARGFPLNYPPQRTPRRSEDT